MYEILVDMSVDIDAAAAEAGHIQYLPMEYMVGDETFLCDKPQSLEAMHHYYEGLRQKKSTRTSQITPYQYEEAFTAYAEKGQDVIYLCLSSGLSSTYASACTAAAAVKEQYPQAGLEVVDVYGTTGGMGLLAEWACRNREAGMPLAENAQWLRTAALKINYWFKVEDLMYLKRGGRVSATSAVVGTALNIKPVLFVTKEGKLGIAAKRRGKNLAMRYMVDEFNAHFDPSMGNIVYICCSDCMGDSELLKQMLLETHPDLVVRQTSLSPIIGAHTGPDTLVLIAFAGERPQ